MRLISVIFNLVELLSRVNTLIKFNYLTMLFVFPTVAALRSQCRACAVLTLTKEMMPDLALRHYFLYFHLKSNDAGDKFNDDEYKSLYLAINMCLQIGGNYVEKLLKVWKFFGNKLFFLYVFVLFDQ